MLTMYSHENRIDCPWSRWLDVESLENLDNTEMNMDVTTAENTQSSSKDTYLYKSCPVWEELIFVRCKQCNCSILPEALKSHYDTRHTGREQYEKDPELHIFRKIKRPISPVTSPQASTPRASLASSVIEIPYSRATSAACSSVAYSGAEFSGWPNSPQGAFQQSPLNMTMGVNIVRVKPENSRVKVVIPAHSKIRSGSGVSVLGKNISLGKNMQELSALEHTPLMQSDQSFSFASTSACVMPSTSTTVMSSTSSHGMPSTSSGLSCQAFPSTEPGFERDLVCSSALQSSSSTSTVDSMEGSQSGKNTPILEKLVLRRVLQTDPKASAVRRQSVQGLKGVTKNKKDSSKDTYFMVVNNKERQHNFMVARQHIRKRSNVVYQDKDKVDQRIKNLQGEREVLISQLFQELQNVKQKLNQCNLSKQELQKELLAVKAQLEETKRTTDYQTAILSKQNAEYENEIQELKQRIDDLTTSTNSFIEQTQMYGLGNHPWNFPDDHMSKQLQACEEQKLELQRRVDELECELRELKNSSTIEKGRHDAKLRQYFKIINHLKIRLDAQVTQSEELELQRDFYEKHLPPEVCFQVKSQLAAFQRPSEVYEVYPGLMAPQPAISPPAVPLTDTLLTDIQNINYRAYQSQLSPEMTEMFQQQQVIGDEEVS